MEIKTKDKMDRQTWNIQCAVYLAELTGVPYTTALDFALAFDAAYEADYTPVEAVDDELTYWGD